MTLTLDTSALYAIINQGDPDHDRVRQARDAERGPYLVPAGILAEVTYMVESTLPLPALEGLLTDLETGAYALDCGERDFSRIRYLVKRYADLPLGFADGAVVACAERQGGRVATLDRRNFDVVARGEGSITVLPE
ncbi:MAG: type II toxin-antitoxin system VapC family toxin [Chloroflexota bacterium]|nr:MAG: VapC toxin family PIN domain ribonuclease [Chloroflexota bacterium]